MYSNYYDIMLTTYPVVGYAKKNPVIGDICLKDNKIYLYSSKNEWTLIENTIPTNDTIYYTKPRKLKPKICVCCGAPFHNNKCEYCGTEYYLAGD